jgi:hypothetical protein
VRLPSVRLARRDELAALARVAPLLRAARDLDLWLSPPGRSERIAGQPGPALTAAAAVALDLAPREVQAAWHVVHETSKLTQTAGGAGLAAILATGPTESVLAVWDTALAVVLDSEELDGIATALYTAGAPVGMDGLFDAFATAASGQGGAVGADPLSVRPSVAQAGQEGTAEAGIGQADAGRPDAPPPGRDHRAVLSQALEALADLGVVELGTEDGDGSLTVALSPLGVWGMHRRLRAQGWPVPVLGAAGAHGAHGLLAALATCDAEDGEAEISAWLQTRTADVAAAELIDAAANGSPGQRGAAFAVLDRIGMAALDQVRAALEQPLVRAHAAVWLLEHGEDARLDPADRTWLLVDLGAGLLEEASPQDVVAELLPDLPTHEQAEIVSGLWQVSHPGVTGLLTALSDHHPDPGVARAARKAAFKAGSPAPTGR